MLLFHMLLSSDIGVILFILFVILMTFMLLFYMLLSSDIGVILFILFSVYL